MAEHQHIHRNDDLIKSTRKDTNSAVGGPTKQQIQRAIENPTSATLTPDILTSLQSSHGNTFVNRLVQRMNDAPTVNNTLSYPIQAKLTVTAADDAYENEADAVAKDVVSNINNGGADVQRDDEEEMMMQRDLIQRDEEEEEMMMQRDLIQRDEFDYMQGGDVSGNVEQQIENSRGSGQPLDDTTRSSMEGAFGADFSNVRVHTDSKSNELNNAVQAKAFTTGNDIFFKQGTYNPNNTAGQELLAHELTHTIQQGAASVQKKDDDQT